MERQAAIMALNDSHFERLEKSNRHLETQSLVCGCACVCLCVNPKGLV